MTRDKTKKLYSPKNGLDPREVALCVLLSVTEGGRKSDVCLRETLRESSLSAKDRALVKIIVDGALDHLIRLDHIIQRYLKRPIGFLNTEAKGILRISVYQILFLDRVPDAAVCNEAVELTKTRGLKQLSGFVNAVLRNVVRDKEAGKEAEENYKDKSVYLSVPKWLYKKLCSDNGEKKAEEIARVWLEKRPVTVRLNTSIMKEDDIVKLLNDEGAGPEKIDIKAILGSYGLTLPEDAIPAVYSLTKVFDITKLDTFKRGLFLVQDAASTLPAAMSGVKEGDHVIDVCAAPGGKTLQLCDILKGSGLVEARDISEKKLELIRENAERIGFKNIKIRQLDAFKADEESFYRADIVMMDPPCSGLGVAGRKPDIKYDLRSYSIEELRGLQRDMLMSVARYVKPKGRLVYSTCTITPEEDEENITWAMSHLGFRLISSIKLLPTKLHDGFYVAVMEKGYDRTQWKT